MERLTKLLAQQGALSDFLAQETIDRLQEELVDTSEQLGCPVTAEDLRQWQRELQQRWLMRWIS